MKIALEIGKKVNRFRKKNWSAPTVMTVFILSCMIIIFSIESLGLSNRNKNLDMRIYSPEKIITSHIKSSKNCSDVVTDCLDFVPVNSQSGLLSNLAEEDKLKNVMIIKSILIKAATQQFYYEHNITESTSQEYFINSFVFDL
jgi:hypothetical protein